MSLDKHVMVFGEVLYDCFPDGSVVLGGAPFNVAWHLQALGDQPQFISRIGHDTLGDGIAQAMVEWGMDLQSLQRDVEHETGKVDITLVDGDPEYRIKPDCAYDFIDWESLSLPDQSTVLYHGSLALRNPVSRSALDYLASAKNISIFLDVNLRSPWWHAEEVSAWLQRSRWAKLNEHELQQLGERSGNLHQDMAVFQQHYGLELLVVTQGEKGALVRESSGKIVSVIPDKTEKVVDTVGAGDAFTAVFLHGLLHQWPHQQTLNQAQQFASQIVARRGAIPKERDLYQVVSIS